MGIRSGGANGVLAADERLPHFAPPTGITAMALPLVMADEYAHAAKVIDPNGQALAVAELLLALDISLTAADTINYCGSANRHTAGLSD